MKLVNRSPWIDLMKKNSCIGQALVERGCCSFETIYAIEIIYAMQRFLSWTPLTASESPERCHSNVWSAKFWEIKSAVSNLWLFMFDFISWYHFELVGAKKSHFCSHVQWSIRWIGFCVKLKHTSSRTKHEINPYVIYK